MEFKAESLERLKSEWEDHRLSPMVKKVVEDAAAYAAGRWGWNFVITSIYRTPAEDAALHASGIHVDWRAVDVRTNDRPKDEVEDVDRYVNDKYIYDAARPALKVCFSEPHGNGVHAHFQVHPNTKLRETPAENGIAAPDTTGVGAGFVGDALPLDEEGQSEIVERLGVGPAELWAILTVETRGCGFQSNRRPFILFERHVFSRLTKHKFDLGHPDISNKSPGGYGAAGDHQYDRLARAIQLDSEAALESASWGIGQLMGFNASIAGYPDVEAMVRAMQVSELDQLRGMAGELLTNKLDSSLRDHNWAKFAKGYNGKNYAINKYDTRLAAAYSKLSHGGLPDLTVRQAQVYLTYLGYSPGAIDGQPGKFTFAALNDYQLQHSLPVKNLLDEEIIASLRADVAALP